MPRLGPRVGEQDKGAIDRRIRQTINKLAGIIAIEPDIAEIVVPDASEQLDDAVDKRLTPDNPGGRVVFRLPGKVLAAAKTDFKPDLIRRRIEQAAGGKLL